jgi:hypothetical protein
MSFLSEDERIKQRIHYFGYQAFWITFWFLIAGRLILGDFLDKIIMNWFFMPSIAISGLLFFVIRAIWDGIDILKFKNKLTSSPKKLFRFFLLFMVITFFYDLVFDPEFKNHLVKRLVGIIISCLIAGGFLYLSGKFIDWRNKKALGSEKDNIES